jgi:hypothetical protein
MQPSAAKLNARGSGVLQGMQGKYLLFNPREINEKYLNSFFLFFLARAIYRFLDCITCNGRTNSKFSLASEPCIRVATRLATGTGLPFICLGKTIGFINIVVGNIFNALPLPWPFASVQPYLIERWK